MLGHQFRHVARGVGHRHIEDHRDIAPLDPFRRQGHGLRGLAAMVALDQLDRHAEAVPPRVVQREARGDEGAMAGVDRIRAGEVGEHADAQRCALRARAARQRSREKAAADEYSAPEAVCHGPLPCL